MKKALAVFAVVLAVGMTAALDAEAKRLGGGKSAGMQRQTTTQPAQPAGTPAQGANTPAPSNASTAAAAPGAAAAAAPKRSWMGPIAGLAAGLGIAALASHFGFGEALANMLTIGLVIMAVLLLVGFIMRKRMGAGAPAAAAGPAGALEPQMYRTAEPSRLQGGSMIGSRLGSSTPQALPADFDAAAFERNAADQFMALQSANDAGDYDRLRGYLTPEMFEVVKAEIAERGQQPQATQVFGLQARVLAVAEEADRYVVSVHFTGSVRDQKDAVPEDLNETWHLVKPRTGFGGWLVAGIQQG
ncbi:MAG: Tim44 domain-containing protein [Burkholderiales bacterium]|nr:Tim44 domain-containing protein [Burkholderiales bacterium]